MTHSTPAIVFAALILAASAGAMPAHGQMRDDGTFATRDIERFDRDRARIDSGRVRQNFRAPRLETYRLDDGLPGGRRLYDGANRYKTDRFGRVIGRDGVPIGRVRP